MEKYLHIIKESGLFSGISRDNLSTILYCLKSNVRRYKKGDFIFREGESPTRIGLVINGSVQVIREDISGNRTMLASFNKSDIFGEAFTCACAVALPISVVARCDCIILFLDYRRIINVCSSACTFHRQLIENMLKILAAKNLLLNAKIEILSARKIRDKLIIFLNAQAAAVKSASFEQAFTRQELADFLSVDRSALSREISCMQKQGIIRAKGKRFEIINTDNTE